MARPQTKAVVAKLKMDDELLKILNSHVIVNEDGDLIKSFQYENRDGKDFMSISKGLLLTILTDAYKAGAQNGQY